MMASKKSPGLSRINANSKQQKVNEIGDFTVANQKFC